MGLSASQARFLGLTARKSNVEYQVQQINQQRTALSNEVMGLYEKYNNLEVPTPPSVNDSMKTVYTIDSTEENYEISSFTKILSGENEGYYQVELTWNKEIPTAYDYRAKDSLITAEKNASGSFSNITLTIGTESFKYDENDNENSTLKKITENYESYNGLSTIMKENGITDGPFYSYIKNGNTYYTPESELLDVSFDEKNQYYGDYTFYYQGTQVVPETVNTVATLTQQANGRLATIQVIESEDAPELVGKPYSITTSQEQDTLGLTQKTYDYEYKKMLYEREVETINKKTKEIQEQDRALELQINQLDTEQNALATEMDSVKKVIEETVEKVFKTFSG